MTSLPRASPVNDWLRYPPTRKYDKNREDPEVELMRQQLEASKAEIENLRLQLRVNEKYAALGRKGGFESPISFVVDPEFARMRAQGASSPYATRDPATALKREDALLTECMELDRKMQEMKNEMQKLQNGSPISSSPATRVQKLAQDLVEAQCTINAQRQEIRDLQDRLATAGMDSETSKNAALREHREVIELQEALLQERFFENDRLRKLVQEQRTQISLLQSQVPQTMPPSMDPSTYPPPPQQYDLPPPQRSDLLPPQYPPPETPFTPPGPRYPSSVSPAPGPPWSGNLPSQYAASIRNQGGLNQPRSPPRPPPPRSLFPDKIPDPPARIGMEEIQTY